MKKVMLLVVVIFALAISLTATPVKAGELLDGIVPLGQDHVKMTWYMVNCGRISGTDVPYAVVRKYYTNTGIKDETIELLMSKFGLDSEKAGSLYFTEYIYNYSTDHKMFSVGYIRHYDMVGILIHGTDYDGYTEATKPTWVNVEAKGPSGLSLVAARKVLNIPDPSAPAPRKR